jgi:hypothetical protein
MIAILGARGFLTGPGKEILARAMAEDVATRIARQGRPVPER